MTALPTLTDADWQRMSWRAKQQWLTAANKLRREMEARLARNATIEANRAIVARFAVSAGIDPGHYDIELSLTIAREIHKHLPDDPHGPERLAALDPRSGDGATADAHRARNAAAQRARRARERGAA